MLSDIRIWITILQYLKRIIILINYIKMDKIGLNIIETWKKAGLKNVSYLRNAPVHFDNGLNLWISNWSFHLYKVIVNITYIQSMECHDFFRLDQRKIRAHTQLQLNLLEHCNHWIVFILANFIYHGVQQLSTEPGQPHFRGANTSLNIVSDKSQDFPFILIRLLRTKEGMPSCFRVCSAVCERVTICFESSASRFWGCCLWTMRKLWFLWL